MDTQQQDSQQEHQTQNGVAANGAQETPATKDSGKGNEDKKIFVGGIAYDVTSEDLTSYFSQFGEVSQAQVKYDRNTGRSRGFAFVEFTTGEACKAALGMREQTLKNKQIEVKPAKSRENKKVFVGGLPADHPEAELRAHFEQYGKVEDIEWPFDKQTKARRNFAFIVFEEEEAADRASATPKQTFGSREEAADMMRMHKVELISGQAASSVIRNSSNNSNNSFEAFFGKAKRQFLYDVFSFLNIAKPLF